MDVPFSTTQLPQLGDTGTTQPAGTPHQLRRWYDMKLFTYRLDPYLFGWDTPITVRDALSKPPIIGISILPLHRCYNFLKRKSNTMKSVLKALDSNDPHAQDVRSRLHAVQKAQAKLKKEINFAVPCASCDKVGYKQVICCGCKARAYCDAKCQKAHWKEHKKICQQLKKTEPPLDNIAATFREENDARVMLEAFNA